MEECVFSGDDESQMTSVSYTPRSGEFELSDNFIILENNEKTNFRSKCDTYETVANFFCRFLSLIYFFSFLASMNQALGLFGSHGIYDVYANTTTFLDSLKSKTFYESLTEFPSVFLALPISDFTLKLVPLVGMVSSFLMFLTGFNCMYSFLFLWVLKLSFVALFKTLPKTMSDLLLLEVGFLAIFIFSPFKFFDRNTSFEVPTLVKWSFRFLVYRVVLLSGVYKVFLLKKMNIQHVLMSVPLPTFFNYYLVGLVSNFKFFNLILTTLLIFFEVVLSVFLVTPYRSCRLFGGLSVLVYSLTFSLLGNFGPFYLLLMLSGLFCLDDQFLSPFVGWRFNPFRKTDLLMRKVSVDLVDTVLCGDENNDSDKVVDVETGGCRDIVDQSTGFNGVRISDNSPDSLVNCEETQSENDSENASFGSVYFDRILSNLNYSRHRECIREFMNIDNRLSNNLFSECFKKVVKDLLLLFYLTVILVLSALLFLFHNYRGLKAFVLFLFCVLLKSHCEAVKTKITFLQGQYTLYFLQALLVFEMLKHGPSVWSFFLWVALVELQLSLSKKLNDLNYLAKMIIQSFLFIHLVLYNTRIFHSSFKEVLFKANPQGSLNNYNDSGIRMNSFYSINNYRSVYHVNAERVEVVLEGTNEQYISLTTKWREFDFKQKPSRLERFPYFVPFYEYTLDEQLVVTFNTKHYSMLASDQHLKKKVKNAVLNNSSFEETQDEVKEVVERKYVVNHLNQKLNPVKDDDERDVFERRMVNGGSEEVDNQLKYSEGGRDVTSEEGDKKEVNPVGSNDRYLFDLMKALLMGSEDVNGLLLSNPFGTGRPTFMRVLLYKYYFTSLPKALKNEGKVALKNWYYREFIAELVPPLSYLAPDMGDMNKLLHKKRGTDELERNGNINGRDNFKDEKMDSRTVNGGLLETQTNKLTKVKDNKETGKTTNENRDSGNHDFQNEDEVVSVVHTMPASNHKTVPLNMADSFNHKIPNVDGIVITTK